MTTDRLANFLACLPEEMEHEHYDAAREIVRESRPPIADILKWIDDVRPEVREMVCFLLGSAGYAVDMEREGLHLYPEGVPSLLRLLEDPNENVRSASAAALGFHTLSSTLPALLRLVEDPSAEVRWSVSCTLGSFHSWEEEEGLGYKAKVEAALLQLIDDKDEDVRDWATFGIHQGGHNTPAARARLWKALDDPDPDVRAEAIEGLALFGDRSLIPRLRSLLADQETLSPSYFLAAELLGDPVLLPDVLNAAQRWHAWGQTSDGTIESAIQVLQKAAEAHKAERS